MSTSFACSHHAAYPNLKFSERPETSASARPLVSRSQLVIQMSTNREFRTLIKVANPGSNNAPFRICRFSIPSVLSIGSAREAFATRRRLCRGRPSLAGRSCRTLAQLQERPGSLQLQLTRALVFCARSIGSPSGESPALIPHLNAQLSNSLPCASHDALPFFDSSARSLATRRERVVLSEVITRHPVPIFHRQLEVRVSEGVILVNPIAQSIADTQRHSSSSRAPTLHIVQCLHGQLRMALGVLSLPIQLA